jgi:hypothetical protein
MTSFSAPPPGWERETPKYRATRAVHPSPNDRHRFESPFATLSDPNVWQFAERDYTAGDQITTRDWPHPSFIALNYSAGKVLQFFNSAPKSRLPRSPFDGDRLRLDDGLTGANQPKFPIKTGATAT